MGEATYENPWPERVDVVEARSILTEFVAGCSNHDIALLYATVARNTIVLVWEGRDYLTYGPGGREWASLERAKRERSSFEPLLAALKDLIDQLEAIGIPDWHGAEGLSLDRAKEAINKAEGRSQ
jgi:hypothetical protein